MNKDKKIFVIGFNKTGTCSVCELLRSLKIKASHNARIKVLDLLSEYEAFTDGTHVRVFKQYYDKCPNSLFILNTRPISKWLQ